MVIDVSKLLAKGEYEGDFSYDFEAGQDLVLVPLFHFDGPVHIEGSFCIYEDNSIDVLINLKFRLKGQCSYCLEDAQKDIEYEYRACFVTEESDDDYTYDGRAADITLAVNDAILFSQPSVILCRDDCKGIGLEN